MESPRRKPAAVLALASRSMGVTATVIGVMAFVGWAGGPTWLTSMLTGGVPMNPMTALCFLLAGLALWLLRPDAAPWWWRPTGWTLAALVTLVAMARAGEYAGVWDAGIDRLLFAERLTTVAHGPNRMAPNTTLNFLLLGLALLLLNVETRAGRRPAQRLALAALVVSLLAATGYAYSAGHLTRIGSYIPMALSTALAFTLLSAGILCARPDRDLMGILTSDLAGGRAARRLLPAAIGVPWVLGWLRLRGEQAGLYDTEFGVALIAVTTMVVLAVVVWWTARALDRTDAERARVEKALAEHAAEVRDLYDRAPCGYHSLDRSGVFRRINATELAWLGYRESEVVGRMRFSDLVTPQGREVFAREFPRFQDRGYVSDLEFDLVRKDGTLLPVLLSATAIRDAAGRYVQSRSIIFDVSDRKRAEHELARLHADLERHAADLETANAELEAFTYSVSHDLRAPLRAIDGFSRRLVESHDAQLDAEGHRLLDVVRGNARQMERLIDDLLALSSLGRQALATVPVDMTALATTVVTELQRLESERLVTVRIDDLPPALADPSMTRQVLLNLIGNAFKFTRNRANATVEVGATRSAEETVYFVRDNGAGFDMRFAHKLFEVFQRLHGMEDFEGTGVGLAIVQRVVARHGGRVWADGAVDGGATFSFTLPAAPDERDGRVGAAPR